MKIVEFTQASFYNEYEVSISLIKIKPCSSSFGLMVTEKHHNQRNEGASGRVDCIKSRPQENRLMYHWYGRSIQ